MDLSLSAQDRIKSVKLSSLKVPLKKAVSDAKVLTGRQKALESVDLLIAEIVTQDNLYGLGFSYTLRTGAPAIFAHANEIASLLIDEDPNDISKLWDKMMWASATIGRNGVAAQSVAALDTALWDLKAKRANLSLSKLIGSQRDAVNCYNTSGGYLQASIEEVIAKAQQSRANGINGVKIKVGHPDHARDIARVEALRKALGDDVPIMADANQQWNRTTAMRMGKILDQYNLIWLEEPLDAYDVDGHKMLADALITPIGTGEMLTSVKEVAAYIEKEAADLIMHDAPRVGGITPFLKVSQLAENRGLMMAPHFVMEIHIHLAAVYAHETWIEHFEWLEPVFNERLEIANGKMIVPTRPGLGLTLNEQISQWRVAETTLR